MNEQPVIYKDSPGHAGYRIGSDGTVWSCWVRIYKRGKIGLEYALGNKWIQLKLDRSSKYMAVHLKRKKYWVHRLVLEAFVGPCPVGMEARHFPNNNREDNRISNLSWNTKEVNTADRAIHGTNLQGERNSRSKLTAVEVLAIRSDFISGRFRKVDLANRHNVTRTLIGNIIKRKCWVHLPEQIAVT